MTWETLYEHLTREMNLREDEVLIHTGTRRDLDKLAAGEILGRKCPARFVLTVQALKEGWDCPFAYVLCSVHNLSSRTAVEQILGRVLRMPGALRKKTAELNHAYAFATSSSFAESAKSLVDALVDSGFNPFEAKYVVRRDNLSLPFEPSPEQAFEPIEESVISAPRLDELPENLRERVSFAPLKQELVYQGPPLSQDETTWLVKCFTNQRIRTQ